MVVVFLLNKVDNYFDSTNKFLFFFDHFNFPRYLKEIGYVDTIIDIRSTAVKKLLGIKSETNGSPASLNGDHESKR